MNSDSVEIFSKIIQSFARDTPLRIKFTDFDFTLNSYQWFMPWFKEYFLQTEFLFISLLIVIINITILSALFFLQKKNNDINFIKTTFPVIIILFLNLVIWMRAPDMRFSYGSIISLVALLSGMILIKFKIRIFNNFVFYIIILLIFAPITLKNKNKIDRFVNSSFVGNFNSSNFEVIYETNGYNVYKPSDVFCNDFNGFCTYQGFKVSISEKNNYLFIREN